jgi:hypothetical protein
VDAYQRYRVMWPLVPVNIDALNRFGLRQRGEASGVVQTARSFGSAVGVAVLGTIVCSSRASPTRASRASRPGVPSCSSPSSSPWP